MPTSSGRTQRPPRSSFLSSSFSSSSRKHVCGASTRLVLPSPAPKKEAHTASARRMDVVDFLSPDLGIASNGSHGVWSCVEG